MNIIGLNSYHGDASACLVREGKLIAAVEEERFRRIKHWAGFPSEAIRYCLAEAGLTLVDIDYVAINSDPKANTLRRIGYAVRQRPDIGLVRARLRNRRGRGSIENELAQAFPGDQFGGAIHRIEHHLAHLASAFYVSPFRDAAVVSIDGFGDFSSAAWGVGEGETIRIDGRVYFPHSLGIFYQAITQYLGFPHYGDEYKMMGLAPYGEPSFETQMHGIVRLKPGGNFELDLGYFRHHRENIAYQWSNGSPQVDDLFSPQLEELLGPKRNLDEPLTDRHRDIARSAQVMYEQAVVHLLQAVHKKTGQTALTLAGGCAMNSVANGKVRRMTPFQKLYVQAAAGDAGGAIGSAFAVWQKFGGKRSFIMDHAYWGPGFSDAYVAELLMARRSEIKEAGCAVELISDESELCRRTAAAIEQGKVAGWFQGRMEWGPRALGNRSILGDPRRADMKALLNEKIKRRESFRPFAPSILEEAVPDWFEEDDAVPFMMQVFQVRAEKRDIIPAVTHVDGSGRLQTVSQRANPRFYQLIKAFAALTDVPMLLNTSFNENEPVVCRPEQALDCFLRTRIDLLVLGDVFVQRNQS